MATTDRDYYEVLGIARDADETTIKKSFRRMARELHPQGIHVAHIVVDGGIRSARRPVPPDKPDSLLDPDAIADTYLHLIRQPRSAWSWEVEVRPWVEHF